MIDPRILSRRSFMRRMLGAGVGLLSLEFAGASLAMLFPGPGEGIEPRVPQSLAFTSAPGSVGGGGPEDGDRAA